MAGGGGGGAAVATPRSKFKLPGGRKRARVEIIPLIDVMFFLLAAFMMISLSMQKMKTPRMDLAAEDEAGRIVGAEPQPLFLEKYRIRQGGKSLERCHKACRQSIRRDLKLGASDRGGSPGVAAFRHRSRDHIEHLVFKRRRVLSDGCWRFPLDDFFQRLRSYAINPGKMTPLIRERFQILIEKDRVP